MAFKANQGSICRKNMKKHLETSRRAIISYEIPTYFIICPFYMVTGTRPLAFCWTRPAAPCDASEATIWKPWRTDFPLYQVTFHFVWCWRIFDLPAIQQLWHHVYLLICYSDQTDAFGRRRGGRSYVARVPSNLSRPDQQGVSGCVIVLRRLAFMCVICQEA